MGRPYKGRPRLYYYLLSASLPANLVVGVYDSPERLGIGFVAHGSGGHIMRASPYFFSTGQHALKPLLRELTMAEALLTGVPIDDWAGRGE